MRNTTIIFLIFFSFILQSSIMADYTLKEDVEKKAHDFKRNGFSATLGLWYLLGGEASVQRKGVLPGTTVSASSLDHFDAEGYYGIFEFRYQTWMSQNTFVSLNMNTSYNPTVDGDYFEDYEIEGDRAKITATDIDGFNFDMGFNIGLGMGSEDLGVTFEVGFGFYYGRNEYEVEKGIYQDNTTTINLVGRTIDYFANFYAFIMDITFKVSLLEDNSLWFKLYSRVFPYSDMEATIKGYSFSNDNQVAQLTHFGNGYTFSAGIVQGSIIYYIYRTPSVSFNVEFGYRYYIWHAGKQTEDFYDFTSGTLTSTDQEVVDYHKMEQHGFFLAFTVEF